MSDSKEFVPIIPSWSVAVQICAEAYRSSGKPEHLEELYRMAAMMDVLGTKLMPACLAIQTALNGSGNITQKEQLELDIALRDLWQAQSLSKAHCGTFGSAE
jgi:hypothetical protein